MVAQAAVSRPPGRYGDDRPAWHRVLARTLVATLALVGVGFLVWVAVDTEGQEVRSTDIGFHLATDAPAAGAAALDPGEVTVDFLVSMDPGAEATCTIRALNARFAVVGVADVPISASQARSQRVTGTLRVSEPAVSAGVQSCVLR